MSKRRKVVMVWMIGDEPSLQGKSCECRLKRKATIDIPERITDECAWTDKMLIDWARQDFVKCAYELGINMVEPVSATLIEEDGRIVANRNYYGGEMT